MPNSGTDNVVDNGVLEQIIVTAQRKQSDSSISQYPDRVEKLEDVQEMLNQTRVTLGKLAGKNYHPTGATATIDWNLRTPAVAYRLEDDEENAYHIYLPDDVQYVWETPASSLKNIILNSVRVKDFSSCEYIRFQNTSGSQISFYGRALEITGMDLTTGYATVSPVDSGERANALIFCNEEGGSAIPNNGYGIGIVSGSFLYNIAAPIGSQISYDSSGLLATTAEVAYIGTSLKDRASGSPTGPNEWAQLSINLKVGYTF